MAAQHSPATDHRVVEVVAVALPLRHAAMPHSERKIHVMIRLELDWDLTGSLAI